MVTNEPFSRKQVRLCLLISENVCNTVSDTDITPGYRTDHFMLTPELIFGEDCEKEGVKIPPQKNNKKQQQKTTTTTTKHKPRNFYSSLLKDSEFAHEMNGTIEKII